ncbi:hypothetical protein [Loigolactobacillus zhaoyuanensis]|uniref:Mga helix-turn-helix domain-containing protein n=1 Tax=Loigolactobacillus zhaoyuanensis TaxID=2486017 RepID=A0ABW8UJ23_9LACO
MNQQEMTGTLIDTVMKKITTQFAQPFTPAGDMCLRIWLYISEKRRHTTELAAVEFFAEPIDFTTTSVKLMKAFSDPYFDQYLFEHNRNERTLLYMFVQGGLVLDTHNHDAQSFISDVAQQNGVRQLNQRFIQITQQYFDFDQLAAPFKRYLIDTLTQIHYNFIHFHGLFHMTQQQPAVTLNSYLAAVYQRLLQPEVGTTAVFTKYLSWRYLPLLYLMMHASQVHLRVGCDFAVETSLASVLINQIRGALPANIKVELRRYHAGSKYDVVLTDMCKGYQEVSTDQIFIFLNLQNEVDLPPLATFLTDHYFNKLFK